MKKTIIVTLLFITGLNAENQESYITLAPNMFYHEQSGTGTDSDFQSTAFKWTFGKEIYQTEKYGVFLEGSALLGVDEKEKSLVVRTHGGTLSHAGIRVDQLYNLNLKVAVSLTEQLDVNGYTGVSRGKTVATATNYTGMNDFKNSFSFGGGMAYWFDPQVGAYVNYMQYFSNLSAVEVGLGFRF